MTTRRELLIAIGAGMVWGPLKAVAQQARSMPIVGVLSLEVADRVASLREGLRKLGYVEGRNIRLEMRNPGDRYAQLAEIARHQNSAVDPGAGGQGDQVTAHRLSLQMRGIIPT